MSAIPHPDKIIAAPARPRLPRRALSLVLTRGVSAFGSSMTAYGLDVWIFKTTGSYATFALLAMLTFLPNLLLAPFTGTLVDRCNKKWLLLACELLTLAAVLFALELHRRGLLERVSAGAIIIALSVVGHIRWTAMNVTLSTLVPPESRARMNGIEQAFQGLADFMAPLLGTAALQGFTLGGVLAMDIVSCVIAITGLVVVPAVQLRADASHGPRASLWRDAVFGLKFVGGNAGLRRLLLSVMFYNLAGSVFSVTFTPYILSFSSVTQLGIVCAVQGSSAIFAAFALGRWADRFHAESLLFCSALGFGALLVFWGVARGPVAVVLVAFTAGCLTSTVAASLQTIWQGNVPIAVQGRVFATRRMISFLLVPVAILSSIPLANNVCVPLLASHGPASRVWGDGLAGALGMMTSLLGAALVAGCAWHYHRSGTRFTHTVEAIPA